MEGNIIERRQSSVIPPPWLEPKPQPYTNVFVTPTDGSPRASVDRTDTGFTGKKIVLSKI